MDDDLERIRYWSSRLEDTSEAIKELHDKYNRSFKLSYEENYMLHKYIVQFIARSSLLKDAVADFDSRPKPSFWKRLFHKN